MPSMRSGRFWGSQASLWYWAACLIGNVAIATAASSYLAALLRHQRGPACMGAMFTVAAVVAGHRWSTW